MKLVCKIEHIALPINNTHRLVLRGEQLELPPEQAYGIMANFSHAFAIVPENDLTKTKELGKSDMTKDITKAEGK